MSCAVAQPMLDFTDKWPGKARPEGGAHPTAAQANALPPRASIMNVTVCSASSTHSCDTDSQAWGLKPRRFLWKQ
ncbi:MAG: hypothetical protein OIN86_09935 [Candidatus Methanoperedens sp.]|nr:hypothetical protein [Candidatus Methanoperedens sp.]